ncbi:hypothetical protein THAOC_28169 [Thalassiosira oceanica]|uniref:AWS domain-containing protein n=1 Tax=Thalassiosira oceanica TaxID=159749 RepID=K0RH11_THAOC|nr:hypothetical protein THAOC_28169 [Thalassiosira oceanica]|eukprot:EJK52540.1 hypothetical protein THAOC_28169 [Thalassiosira oceanica]
MLPGPTVPLRVAIQDSTAELDAAAMEFMSTTQREMDAMLGPGVFDHGMLARDVVGVRREERRAARIARGEIDGSDDEGGGAGGSAENKFLVGMHGADTTLEEDQFEQYLLTIEEEEEGGDDEEDGDEGAARLRRRRKKTHLSYCLPVDFKEEVHSKPPAYAHVNSNRYDPDNRPRRSIFSGEKCRCKPSGEDGVPSCGERCDNRLNYFECSAANCDREVMLS